MQNALFILVDFNLMVFRCKEKESHAQGRTEEFNIKRFCAEALPSLYGIISASVKVLF